MNEIEAFNKKLYTNKELKEHIVNLLKNTKFKGNEFCDDALKLAIKFAETNIKINNEVGTPLSPYIETTIERRKLDKQLIALYNTF